MSKTIKIIDLLVRMHKKENLPRKIEISGEEYLYDNISETYVSTLNNQYLGHEISLDFCLNDKVIIIEEQQEIDKLEIDNNGFIHTNNGTWKGRKLDVEFAESINKLAEEIKNIKEMK